MGLLLLCGLAAGLVVRTVARVRSGGRARKVSRGQPQRLAGASASERGAEKETAQTVALASATVVQQT